MLDLIDASRPRAVLGALGFFVITVDAVVWVVRVGGELYVRSYRGRRGGWFRRALASHQGHIRAAGIERDVILQRTRRRGPGSDRPGLPGQVRPIQQHLRRADGQPDRHRGHPAPARQLTIQPHHEAQQR